MSKYFWTYQTDLPQGSGYELYSVTHLVIIAIAIMVSFCYVYIYRKKDIHFRKKDIHFRKKMSLATAIILPALIAIRTIYILLNNVPIKYELPLHLCSMTGILIFIHCILECILSKLCPNELHEVPARVYVILHDFLSQVLYSLCLPGAACAILFPDGNIYPAISFISFESYSFHILIVAYIIGKLFTGEIRPSLRKSYYSFIFLAIVVPPVYIFDRINNINYMFLIRPVPGSPLELFEKWLGNPGYLWGYGALAALVIILMNLLGQKLSALFPHNEKNIPLN